jgi:hypothetical protein
MASTLTHTAYTEGMRFIAHGKAKTTYKVKKLHGRSLVTLEREKDGKEVIVEPESFSKLVSEVL